MRNIMTVVRERDIAYNLLETGKTGEPTPQIRYEQSKMKLNQTNCQTFVF